MRTQSGQDSQKTALPIWALWLVHVLFFMSGAAALIYEVVWMRMLSFVFGNTTYAVSVVLALFLSGLAIGAWVYGRVADRRADLLRVYGLLEAGAAAIALVLPLVLLRVLNPVYAWIYQRSGESILALTAARVVLNAALLIPPATLLGGTLPVLIRFIARSDRAMEGHIGRLYGLNTLGGVAGTFSAGFLLMPSLGLRLSNVVAVALGLTVAACALSTHRVLGRRAAVPPNWQPKASPANRSDARLSAGRWLLTAFALSGFAALAYEVLWTRFLVFFFESTVYAFSAMLCVYLAGLALGSLTYWLLISRSSRPLAWFVAIQVLIGLSAAITMLALPALRDWHLSAMKLGLFGHIKWIFLAAAAIMGVPTLLIGVVFPLVCGAWSRVTGRIGSGVGQVYVVNTAGTVVGSLASGFIIIPAIGIRLALYAMAGLNIFAGLVVWAAISPTAWQRAVRGAVALLAPAALMLVMNCSFTARDLVQVIKRYHTVEIESITEGIDGTVTVERGTLMDDVVGQGETRALAINGVNVAGTGIALLTTQKLQAHIAMLLHPGVRRVLHVGFGAGGTAWSVTRYGVSDVDCVEISKAVIDSASEFPEINRVVLSDPRLHVYLEDARTFVRHTPHRYDVILSDLVHPILAGQGFFYSVDYLADCKRLLKPGGLFSTWIPIYSVGLQDFKVMIRSIREVFPYVYIWHSEGGRNQFCVVHGMLQPLAVQYEGFAQRMADPQVLEDLSEIGIRREEEILALLLYDHAAVDHWLTGVEQLNTDDNGYLEFVAPRRAYQFPGSRDVNFLFVYPDLVLNSGGSVLDYITAIGGPHALWRQRLREEVAANQHVLQARLYELARNDRCDLLALMEYRRALALVPDHFVAKMMLGITEGQMAWTQHAATALTPLSIAREHWMAALTATGRPQEALHWAEALARESPAWWAYAAVEATLSQDFEDLARVIRAGRDAGLAGFMGIDPTLLQQVAEEECARAVQSGDASRLRTLGQAYEQMAYQIWAVPVGVQQISPALRMSTFRVQAVAGLLDLAAARYAKALALDPSDVRAKFRLAAVSSSQGEYREALQLAEQVRDALANESENEPAMSSVTRLILDLREKERQPFAFLRDAQEWVKVQGAARRTGFQ